MILSLSRGALAGAIPLAQAYDGHDHEPKPVSDYSFDPADEMVESTVRGAPLWYDADVCLHAGELWYAWLEFAPGKGDQICVGMRAEGWP